MFYLDLNLTFEIPSYQLLTGWRDQILPYMKLLQHDPALIFSSTYHS